MGWEDMPNLIQCILTASEKRGSQPPWYEVVKFSGHYKMVAFDCIHGTRIYADSDLYSTTFAPSSTPHAQRTLTPVDCVQSSSTVYSYWVGWYKLHTYHFTVILPCIFFLGETLNAFLALATVSSRISLLNIFFYTAISCVNQLLINHS